MGPPPQNSVEVRQITPAEVHMLERLVAQLHSVVRLPLEERTWLVDHPPSGQQAWLVVQPPLAEALWEDNGCSMAPM